MQSLILLILLPLAVQSIDWRGDWANATGGGGPGNLWVSYDQFSAAVTGNGFPAPRYDQYEAFINVI